MLATRIISTPEMVIVTTRSKPDFISPLTPSDWSLNWKVVAAVYALLIVVAFCNATFSRCVVNDTDREQDDPDNIFFHFPR